MLFSQKRFVRRTNVIYEFYMNAFWTKSIVHVPTVKYQCRVLYFQINSKTFDGIVLASCVFVDLLKKDRSYLFRWYLLKIFLVYISIVYYFIIFCHNVNLLAFMVVKFAYTKALLLFKFFLLTAKCRQMFVARWHSVYQLQYKWQATLCYKS